jgi:peroxiredoxin
LRTLLKPGEAVALWGISVDSHEDSKGFSEKIASDGKGPISFPLLSDPQHQVIDAYGIEDPRYFKMRREGIPYPSTYVIDKSGKIAWVRIDHNTTIRPPNSEIRAALDALR